MLTFKVQDVYREHGQTVVAGSIGTDRDTLVRGGRLWYAFRLPAGRLISSTCPTRRSGKCISSNGTGTNS